MPATADTARLFPRPVAAKVPEITVVFWVIKVLTTGTGEAASDFLAAHNLVIAAGVGLAGFLVAMWLQFRARRYSAVVYWFAVLMVAVFGTMAADALHVVLGVPYVASTTFYAVALAVVFVLWRRTEGTLSIHSIVTRRRELWYWLTVLLTFALGTAAGDLSAFVLHLGYLGSAVLFAVVIAIPAIAWRAGVNPVATFWVAYVITRPLGASLADWFGKRHALGGLGWGDGTVTVVATLVIAALVGWVAATRHGIQRSPERRPGGNTGGARGGWPTGALEAE